jgi:Ni/Fe-hydrogenase subunit HybB-like protein
VILGVTLSTLHQSSLGTLFLIMSERLHALWYTPIIPLFFFISSVAAGLAMVIGGATVSYWVFHRSLRQSLVSHLGWFMPWVLGFYLILKIGELLVSGEIGMLLSGDRYSLLFLAEMVLGVVLPILLFSSSRVRDSRILSLLASLVVLGGVFLNRFDATWWALRPVEGYSYFPHWMETAVQVGVVSGTIVAYTVIGFLFPLFEGTLRRGEEEVTGAAKPGSQAVGQGA